MKKPPRKWWYSTVAALEKLPQVHDARKTAGWLWYHKLTPQQKVQTLTKKDLQREVLKYYTNLKGHYQTCNETSDGMASKKRKSKKRLTKKQRANLAKGRKVLKAIRNGRRFSEPKELILIKEGSFLMEGKKRGRKKSHKKLHGIEGIEGAKRRSKRGASHKYLHGAADGFNPGNIALDIAGILAGAIGLSFVASMIPIKNAKYKSLIPLGAGIIGLSMPKLAKNRFLNRVSLGALSIGGYTLTKSLVPKIPLMGATDTAQGVGEAIANLPTEEKALLGILPEQLEYQPTEGETDYQGSAPGEMLGSAPGEMLGTEMIEGSAPGEMLGVYESVGESDFE